MFVPLLVGMFVNVLFSCIPQCFDLPRATTSQMLRSLVEQNAAVPETRTAIECELRGELEGALQVYDKLLLQLDDGEDFDGGHPAYVFR